MCVLRSEQPGHSNVRAVLRHCVPNNTFKMSSGSVSVEVTFVPTTCNGGDSCPTHAFTDLSADAWYHEAVDYVLNNGLMGGYGNGYFGPNDTLSMGCYDGMASPVITLTVIAVICGTVAVKTFRWE